MEKGMEETFGLNIMKMGLQRLSLVDLPSEAQVYFAQRGC